MYRKIKKKLNLNFSFPQVPFFLDTVIFVMCRKRQINGMTFLNMEFEIKSESIKIKYS